MENDPNYPSQLGAQESLSGNSSHPPALTFLYPPKPKPEEKKGNVWIRSLSSLALYLVVGYYVFSANWTLLLILTGIVVFHELGHFLAMKMYNYTELGIFFIPLLGAYASGTKKEVSQKQSAIILLAGPLPGIIAGFVLHFIATSENTNLSYESLYLLTTTSALLIFLNLLNLLPIYPLDGGQLLNRLFLDDSRIISKIFIVLSALALIYFSFSLKFYPLLVFPAILLLRLRTDSKLDHLTKKIEDSGINIEKTYEEVTDEEYWKIRNILIENNFAGLSNVNPAPPYEYSSNEDKVVSAIESVLQRTIVQDLGWPGKLLIVLIWIGVFAAPFLVQTEFSFFRFLK
jgi:stage IV sporulation protein FB